MKDILYYNELYDIYGGLLTEKQRQYFEDYYFDNLSFSEIASNYDVSRNNAFKQIHNIISKLIEYEEILQLNSKKDKIYKIIEKAPDNIKKEIEEIL